MYQLKCTIHLRGRKVGPPAVDIQKAILGGSCQKGLPRLGIEGVGDVQHGEVDGRANVGHVAMSWLYVDRIKVNQGRDRNC